MNVNDKFGKSCLQESVFWEGRGTGGVAVGDRISTGRSENLGRVTASAKTCLGIGSISASESRQGGVGGRRVRARSTEQPRRGGPVALICKGGEGTLSQSSLQRSQPPVGQV